MLPSWFFTHELARVPADLDEVRALFHRVELVVDPLVVDRIVELGASIEEIVEAMDVADSPADDPPASTLRVAEIRAILAELIDPREHFESS